MSLLDDLLNNDRWAEFLEYKSNSFVNKKELEKLTKFIEKKEYLNISEEIVNNKYKFSVPKKVLINKNGSTKKRSVYIFKNNETLILKMIYYLLYDYDYLFSDNCFSYRKNISCKQAFYKIIRGSKNKYGYKVDISDYFNSINISKLLDILKDNVDGKCYLFFEGLLKDNRVNLNNVVINEKKGVMAGTPTACFLANIYLKEMDLYFKDDVYARYADDIILFCDTREELLKKVKYIYDFLQNMDLKVNKDKEHFYNKNDDFEFLGFSYKNGVIDMSCHSVKKIKKKIRRKARALRRWAIKKNIGKEKAVKAMNNIFNHKFYFENKNSELNYTLWYFPVINTSKSLKEIDNYFQKNLRYIMTGNYHNKKHWNVSYCLLKTLGYRSLVHEFYEFKKDKN